MKNIKRICIYGGPGSGKSTLAAEMYSLLKKKKRSVELVREWVKNWAYQNKNIKSFDQVLIFANQLHQ